MSFKMVHEAPARLNRSELAVPGSAQKMLPKAAASDADVVFLDLEDAVAPDDKAQARKNVVQALNELDFGDKTVSVRINGLDTHYMYRDVVDVLENAGDRLDLIMIPKVGTAEDVYAVDMLVTQVEQAMGRKKRIGFELIIETACRTSTKSPPPARATRACISAWRTMPPRPRRGPPRSAGRTRTTAC
jgi:malyl-CoA/(S)-citramalyl-CoA lyase